MKIANKNKCFERLGEERLNNQGCLMKIVEYVEALNITVEFQDKYNARIKSRYDDFIKGNIKNPYHPSVCGVGMIGVKYPATINGVITKEYNAWKHMLDRCYNDKIKNKYPSYENTICCDEWLLYENFYNWLHSQENFDKWLNGKRWALDKDILIKGNKVYSPETCCLVPQNVNVLFTKREAARGDLPIGVSLSSDKTYYVVQFSNPLKNKTSKYADKCYTINGAFLSYKKLKEQTIKTVAQIEFLQGNITRRCYNAMMNYEVEITD